MAGDAAEMEAMMAQMQAANGGTLPVRQSGIHNKRKSNLSLSSYNIQELQSKQQTVDPLIEIEDYRAEKVCALFISIIYIVYQTTRYQQQQDMLMKAYDDIDLDDNGDIEFEEFDQGMRRLNVSLTDEEISQIFKLMDSDASNFVDRSEFTMFLTQRFESTELTRFQDAILTKVQYFHYLRFCDHKHVVALYYICIIFVSVYTAWWKNTGIGIRRNGKSRGNGYCGNVSIGERNETTNKGYGK